MTHQTVFDAEAKAQDHVIVLDGLTLKSSVDGEESTGTHESFSQLITNTVLFAGVETSYQNKILGFASNLRMYYFNIRDQYGCSMVEFVPSRRISDGAVGFFDRIRGIFFTPPDGTNPLVAGDVAIRRYVDVRDLTQPGGTCAMPTPDTTSAGTVANLFNDNFWYQSDATHRVLLDTSYHPLPLRVDYDFGEGNAKAVNMYRIHAAYNLRGAGKVRVREPAERHRLLRQNGSIQGMTIQPLRHGVSFPEYSLCIALDRFRIARIFRGGLRTPRP